MTHIGRFHRFRFNSVTFVSMVILGATCFLTSCASDGKVPDDRQKQASPSATSTGTPDVSGPRWQSASFFTISGHRAVVFDKSFRHEGVLRPREQRLLVMATSDDIPCIVELTFAPSNGFYFLSNVLVARGERVWMLDQPVDRSGQSLPCPFLLYKSQRELHIQETLDRALWVGEVEGKFRVLYFGGDGEGSSLVAISFEDDSSVTVERFLTEFGAADEVYREEIAR